MYYCIVLYSIVLLYCIVVQSCHDSSHEHDVAEIKQVTDNNMAIVSKYPKSTKTRSSGKLKGWGQLIEACTNPYSNLGNVSKEFECVTVLRITERQDVANETRVNCIMFDRR